MSLQADLKYFCLIQLFLVDYLNQIYFYAPMEMQGAGVSEELKRKADKLFEDLNVSIELVKKKLEEIKHSIEGFESSLNVQMNSKL